MSRSESTEDQQLAATAMHVGAASKSTARTSQIYLKKRCCSTASPDVSEWQATDQLQGLQAGTAPCRQFPAGQYCRPSHRRPQMHQSPRCHSTACSHQGLDSRRGPGSALPCSSFPGCPSCQHSLLAPGNMSPATRHACLRRHICLAKLRPAS